MASPNPPEKKLGPSPMQQIFEMLNEKFGQGDGEVFQMEFPGRVLDQGTYDYAGSDTINAQQLKPQTVYDAEFRLSDDMYNISNITSGPNEKKLSQVFSEIVFNLIPSSPEEDATEELLHADQDKIRKWLLEEVPNWDPPKEDILEGIPKEWDGSKPAHTEPEKKFKDVKTAETISRVDLYQKLLDKYETERFRWQNFKVKARPPDLLHAAETDIDNYNRMLAMYAPIVDAKLEALWTLVLVRGLYHRVRHLIGLVDVGSASEILQRAKENLRASVLRSIDDTQDVFPVYFSPATWASKLSTAFRPEDLLSDERTVHAQILEKQKERANLLLQMSRLTVTDTEIEKLSTAEREAKRLYIDARDGLLTRYSDTAISAIKLYFDAKSRHDQRGAAAAISAIKNPTELNTALAKVNEPPLEDKDFEDIKSWQADLIKKQSNLQNASEALSRLQLTLAEARGGQNKAALYSLQERIASLTVDIEYLTKMLSAAENPTGFVLVKAGDEVKGVRPTEDTDHSQPVPQNIILPPIAGSASVWTEINESLTKYESYYTTMQQSAVSHIDWAAHLFFGSASGSKSSSSSTSKQSNSVNGMSIQIAFRCMKVTLSRPWLDASLFAQTREYRRNLLTPISKLDAGDIKAALLIEPDQDKAKHDDKEKTLTEANKALLPAWPKAFILAKEVHIIFTSTEKWDDNVVTDLRKQMDAGGGVLCFSCAKSESSSEHRTSAAVRSEEHKLDIRIPAPQIIGWVQQLCPKDECQSDYHPLKQSQFALTRPEVAVV
ncbi:hypothetical protein QBC34DRAFT_406655 [Podospora aff. communis PSN243]|uniref:Uncharacterized protein n=1 Tax=Podospora aff. communis PSN243 TaxID=3040156 RepID=A0AAV9GL90_9PEZI|nr:hypothetical protein QBC34DRAFT_406655 [Podospora aff. communis PSN243]